MDIEQRQSELIDHFVKRASAVSDAAALASVLVEATSHPSLFAFSEILALPNVLQVPPVSLSRRFFSFSTTLLLVLFCILFTNCLVYYPKWLFIVRGIEKSIDFFLIIFYFFKKKYFLPFFFAVIIFEIFMFVVDFFLLIIYCQCLIC